MEKRNSTDELAISKNKSQPTSLNWTSIIILWIGIVLCFFSGIISDIQVILGIILLSLSTLITYYKYELGTKITFGIIVLGVLSIVKFFPSSYSIGFGIGDYGVSFEILIILIGIIHFITNRTILSKFLKETFNRDASEEEIQLKERRKIDGYKNRFSRKSIDELQEVLNNKLLLPEAIKAAEELIDEKEINKNK